MSDFLKSKRRITALVLTALLMGAVFSPPVQGALRMPGEMILNPGQSCPLPRGITASVSRDETLTAQEGALTASGEGETQVSLSLFGLFPLHDMNVKVQSGRMLIPGGQAVGVGMQMEGVMVVGVAADSPVKNHLKAGDTLLSVNGSAILSAEDLSRTVEESGGNHLVLRCQRNNAPFSVTVAPQRSENGYKLGVWVRSSTAGVGTLTYYDPRSGCYGALGHAVSDSDTGRIFSVRTGKMWRAGIVDVKKGMRGAPGELKGSFLKENRLLGTIESNTVYGVYGQAEDLTSPLYSSGIPAGSRTGVHTGKAQILSTVDEGGVRAYDVEIVEVMRQSRPAQKSFVIRVTDETLIEKTGGIVQGMSGSPVIQDGFLIGAVTHVFVDDPLMGYGLFIEWMLEESDRIAADRAA